MDISPFIRDVQGFIPKERIYTDMLRRFAWGTDGSFYRLTPQAVIRSNDEKEVSSVLNAASRHRIPITFRAAGTALSGQSVSDGVLLVAGKSWEGISYNPEDSSVTLEPGVIGSKVNDYLQKFGRRFGPQYACGY